MSGKMVKTLFLLIFIFLLSFISVIADEGCGCGTAKSFNITMDPKDAYNMINNLKGSTAFVILDVRTPEEFKSGHIEGAINIDFYSPDFKDRLSKLSKTKTYLVYCKSGARSSRAVKIMEKMGFTKIYNIYGGINKWKKENLPLVK